MKKKGGRKSTRKSSMLLVNRRKRDTFIKMTTSTGKRRGVQLTRRLGYILRPIGGSGVQTTVVNGQKRNQKKLGGYIRPGNSQTGSSTVDRVQLLRRKKTQDVCEWGQKKNQSSLPGYSIGEKSTAIGAIRKNARGKNPLQIKSTYCEGVEREAPQKAKEKGREEIIQKRRLG